MKENLEFFKIGSKLIKNDEKPYIIAEAGVSHFGSLEKAFKLVDFAYKSGASAVKFQHFKTDNFISSKFKKWHNRMKSRELKNEEIFKLAKYAKRKINFLCTAHDLETLDFLIHKIRINAIKIGSGEIMNDEYLKYVSKQELPTIFSTGMHTEKQIKRSIKVLKSGVLRKIAILHCVTSYPTDPKDINLNYMKTISNFFSGPVGYSDHTFGYKVPLVAASMGASIIEKHISLDFNLKNAQDWKVSLNNEELKSFVQDVREVEDTLKYNKNKLSKIEKSNKKWATKSIIYLNNLKKNHILKDSDLIVKRPAGGIMPFEIKKVIKRKLIKNVLKDSFVKYSDLM